MKYIFVLRKNIKSKSEEHRQLLVISKYCKLSKYSAESTKA